MLMGGFLGGINWNKLLKIIYREINLIICVIDIVDYLYV